MKAMSSTPEGNLRVRHSVYCATGNSFYRRKAEETGEGSTDGITCEPWNGPRRRPEPSPAPGNSFRNARTRALPPREVSRPRPSPTPSSLSPLILPSTPPATLDPSPPSVAPFLLGGRVPSRPALDRTPLGGPSPRPLSRGVPSRGMRPDPHHLSGGQGLAALPENFPGAR